jgi:transposase
MTFRRKHSPAFKLKVACEALLQQRTLAELSAKYGVHSTQIIRWKQQLRDNSPDIFDGKPSGATKKNTELIEELYKQIGQQKVECDWLKKKSEQRAA